MKKKTPNIPTPELADTFALLVTQMEAHLTHQREAFSKLQQDTEHALLGPLRNNQESQELLAAKLKPLMEALSSWQKQVASLPSISVPMAILSAQLDRLSKELDVTRKANDAIWTELMRERKEREELIRQFLEMKQQYLALQSHLAELNASAV